MPIALPLPHEPDAGTGLPPTHAVLEGERGPVTLQSLRPGTRLATREAGAAAIQWLGRRRLTSDRFAVAPWLAPVLIRRGALGADTPSRDLLLSPEHLVLYSDQRARQWFGTGHVPVAALQLTFLPGVEQVTQCDALYIHAIFGRDSAICVNGCWIEGGRMDDPAMADPNSARRAELLHLFPELVTLRGAWRASAESGGVATA
ncbi:Hint domain-containing protein [Rhodosalinus sp.]|uniref:Hint domain-containing protein n=1 Tax=Rhodosalinus sp. TaxID=2047741 RepID=UPI003569A1A3